MRENGLGLLIITNDSGVATLADQSSVGYVMVDLEQLGKEERQGGLGCFISTHTLEDINPIKKAIKKAKLIVRVNPIHNHSEGEINEVIARGADAVMLPMFTTVKEVQTFVHLIKSRAKVFLLLETAQAMARIDDILEVPGIDFIHIGLNDLHLSLKLDFMFELLSGGIVEYLANKIKNKNIPFGFGGIGKVGQGMLPAEIIIREHSRLESKLAILSRTFQSQVDFDRTDAATQLEKEVQAIQKVYHASKNLPIKEQEKNIAEMKTIIRQIIGTKR